MSYDRVGTWEGSDCWCVEADTGRQNSEMFDQSHGGRYLRGDEGQGRTPTSTSF